MPGHGTDHEMDPADRAAAMLATAGYQDVATAEAAGYASSLDTLGCFTDPERGGMGLHYIDREPDGRPGRTSPSPRRSSTSSTPTVTSPGWSPTSTSCRSTRGREPTPPQLFGMDFHQHPTLPLWVLHAWLWKDNPTGIFQDWNPAVRQCPPGVPIFGKDLPT